MGKVLLAVPPGELSCLLGNLFQNLEPPCGVREDCTLAICGYTHSGKYARMLISKDRCTFIGDPGDLAAVRDRRCLEGRCGNG